MTPLIDGRYEVLSKIKDGGMGSVFKVRHVHLDEVRVVKVMRADILDDPDARVRFLREARLAKGLHHDNIAVLHDFAEDREGSFYMVLDFVDGPSLAELLGTVRLLPIAVALDIAVQSLSALGYLHRKNIVHRDVSPENILLTLGEEGRPLVKLIDLGIAKETTGEGLTQSGMFLGKLKYASPEQLGALARGEVIDGRSDVYSLGCVLYQVLTGEVPFRAETPQAYAMSHLMRSPRSFEETDRAGRLPAELRTVVLKAVEKKRENRWESAEAFGAALAAVAAELPEEPSGMRSVAAFIEQHRERQARLTALTGASTFVPSPIPSGPPPAQPGDDQRLPRPAAAPSGRRISGLRLAGLAFGTALMVGLGVFSLGVVWPRIHALVVRPAPRLTGGLVLTSSPWARVASVVDEASGESVPIEPCSTPLFLSLPEGKYRVELVGGPTGSGGKAVPVSLSAERETTMHVDLPGFDLERAVSVYVP